MHAAHPRHEGDDVVFLVFDGIFGVLLFTLLRAAEPNRPVLQLLLPPTHTGQAVAAAAEGSESMNSLLKKQQPKQSYIQFTLTMCMW